MLNHIVGIWQASFNSQVLCPENGRTPSTPDSATDRHTATNQNRLEQ